MSKERPSLELGLDLSALGADRPEVVEDLAERLRNYLPHMFEVVKMDEQDAEYLRGLVLDEYSEDRWITLVDPIGDHLPEDTFEAGYRLACHVLRVVLIDYVHGDGVMKKRKENDDE